MYLCMHLLLSFDLSVSMSLSLCVFDVLACVWSEIDFSYLP